MKNIPLSRMWKTGSGPEITFLFFFFFLRLDEKQNQIELWIGAHGKGDSDKIISSWHF